MDSPARSFEERLNAQPQLKERVAALLAIVEDASAAMEQADEAERRVIAAVRRLGNEALSGKKGSSGAPRVNRERRGLSGVGFSGEERRGVIPAKAGIQEKGRQSWWKRLDARLRGHDGLAYACGPQTRDTGGLDEKPTLMRGWDRPHSTDSDSVSGAPADTRAGPESAGVSVCWPHPPRARP